MNNGTAISAAVLTGMVAGELQELATPPDKQPSLHAPATDSAGAGPHLEYQGFRANFVTVPLTGLSMAATTGQLGVINQPQSAVFPAAPLLAA
jgi:hypothetical protein